MNTVIISPEQYGFRNGHGAPTTIQASRELNKRQKQKRNCNVSIPRQDSFDKVWHQGLIFKIIHFEYPLALVKIAKLILTNFPSNKKQHTLNDKRSESRESRKLRYSLLTSITYQTRQNQINSCSQTKQQ